MPEFIPWPKTHRLNREVIVTEKIDGTNAAVIVEDGLVYAQSRTRLITPGKTTDNFGFAAWVVENEDTLVAELDDGHHFGEWYGGGIQRGYGLDERRFMLFDVDRWAPAPPDVPGVEVATVLYRGAFDVGAIEGAVDDLELYGSVHVPDFPDAEGVVIYHTQGHVSFKITLEGDERPKGAPAYA